jgi:signal peptidase I
MGRNYSSKFISILSLFTILIIFWFVFAPVQIGGPVGYVIINGNSMEPEFQLGDLIITRAQTGFEPDDRVVYEHPQVGFVFHRIIDQEGDIFILKGDNNDWTDSYQPVQEEIIGRYWFVIRGGGNVITKLREPAYFVSFALIIGLLLASIFFFQRNQIKRKKFRKKRIMAEKENPGSTGDNRQDLLLIFGILILAALLLGGVAFTRPILKTVSDNYSFEHHGEFNYSAIDESDIYDTGEIQAGDPVYLKLTCVVDMEYDYQFSSPRMDDADQSGYQGYYQFTAQVSDPDGWNRSLPLVDRKAFSGTEFSTTMRLDICHVQQIIAEKEEKTGTKNRWYDLSILPEIELLGNLGDKPLADEFVPRIAFQIDSSMMRLPGGADDLVMIDQGTVENSIEVPNTLSIFGLEYTVLSARWLAGLILLLSMLISFWPIRSLVRDLRESDVSRIQVQYHPMLMDIKVGSLDDQGSQIVEVSSFRDLSKMAERYGAMILHEAKKNFHRYSVQDEQTIYQYTLDAIAKQPYFPDLKVFKESLIRAQKENELELYYQPVVLLEDRSVVGIEAFIRWNHPRFGLLYPAEFISLAEENGLVPQIDSWVINNSCQQLKDWREFGLPLVPLSINISPTTLLNPNIVKEIRSFFRENKCDPRFLQLEINRSNQVFQDQSIKDRLKELQDIGIRLAIDNFATDEANQINQVSLLPVQRIKTDRSIMQGILKDRDNIRLLKAVVDMANGLGIEVVAQGVESLEQIEVLKEMGVNIAQGFFLGEPVQAKDMAWLLGKKNILEQEQPE